MSRRERWRGETDKTKIGLLCDDVDEIGERQMWWERAMIGGVISIAIAIALAQVVK